MDQKSLLNRYLADAEKEGLTEKSEVSQYLRRRLQADLNLHEADDDAVATSLMWFNKNLDVPDPVGQGRNTVGYTEDRPTDMYGAQKEKRRMSIFEGALTEFCLHLWSDPGDTVLDPFAGRLTRLVKTLEAGRNYEGYDTNLESCQLAWDYLKEHPELVKGKHTANVAHGSLLDEYRHHYPEDPFETSGVLVRQDVDMLLTCPPYWNSEFYGDNPKCLAGTPTYEAFVEELVATLFVGLDRLRPDGYAVVVVKDFFFHRQQVSLHSDVVRGVTAHPQMVQWDCVAKKIGTLREMFHRDIIQHRRTAQTHEYVLVFRKSPPKRAQDVYRKHCFESHTQRPEYEAERVKLRQRVLKHHFVEPKSLHPFLRSTEMSKGKPGAKS